MNSNHPYRPNIHVMLNLQTIKFEIDGKYITKKVE